MIELAQKRGIEVIERRIMPEELADFRECFITGSAAEVTPVAEIAHWTFKPGAITQQLMDDYTSGSAAQGQSGRGLAASQARSAFGALSKARNSVTYFTPVRGDERIHRLVEDTAAAARSMPQQQRAGLARTLSSPVWKKSSFERSRRSR